jgi:PIN domain nuclease of toxin-antitoxin system
MRVLLDTHTLLWHFLGDSRLSAAAKYTIENPTNAVLVSPASYWEISIKVSRGKLILHRPYPVFIQEAITDNGFTILPIHPLHTSELIGLPFHHRDPFDRLLIAQAVVEQIPVISADPMFDSYPVTRIW